MLNLIHLFRIARWLKNWGMIIYVSGSITTIDAQSVFTIPSEQFSTIDQAFAKSKFGDTLIFKEGTYKTTIKIPAGVTIIALSLHKTIFDGMGEEKVITMGNNSTISGCEIRNGRIGIYSEGRDNSILKCIIHDNKQSGISCVGTLPRIEDNIIFLNNGSGIQGWDVRSTVASINHNTIANNNNHGVAIGGTSELIIENNIIAFNQRLGLKVDQNVKIKLDKNCFYYNGDLVMDVPMNNYAFDPEFTSLKNMNFSLSKDSKCKNMGSDNKDLGARFIF